MPLCLRGKSSLFAVFATSVQILMAPLLAHAGMVKLLPDAHVDITNGLPVVAVELFNAGNEPVRVLEVEAEDGSQRSEVRSQKSEGNLQPGEFFRRSIPLPLPPDRPGIYQAVSRIHYEDSSGVPFSSVMVSEFRWKIQGAAEQADAGRQCAGVPSGRAGFIPAMHVAGIKPALPVVPSTNAVSSDEPPMELPSAIDTIVSSLCDATLGRSGTVRVDLELLQDDPVDAMVRLVLPDELGCSTPERQVRLEPDVRRSETFQIENRGALCGGVYPVYAIVEHTAGGRHQSSSAAGSVTVTEWQGSGQSYWVWLGAALGLLIALLAGRPKNTKSSEQKPLRQAQGRSQSAQRESGEDSPPASLETPRHREEKNNVAVISPTGVPVTKIPATLLEGRGEREERFCVLKNLLLLFGFLQKTVARILAGVLTRRNSRNIIFSSRCLGVSSLPTVALAEEGEASGKSSSFATCPDPW